MSERDRMLDLQDKFNREEFGTTNTNENTKTNTDTKKSKSKTKLSSKTKHMNDDTVYETPPSETESSTDENDNKKPKDDKSSDKPTDNPTTNPKENPKPQTNPQPKKDDSQPPLEEEELNPNLYQSRETPRVPLPQEYKENDRRDPHQRRPKNQRSSRKSGMSRSSLICKRDDFSNQDRTTSSVTLADVRPRLPSRNAREKMQMSRTQLLDNQPGHKQRKDTFKLIDFVRPLLLMRYSRDDNSMWYNIMEYIILLLRSLYELISCYLDYGKPYISYSRTRSKDQTFTNNLLEASSQFKGKKNYFMCYNMLQIIKRYLITTTCYNNAMTRAINQIIFMLIRLICDKYELNPQEIFFVRNLNQFEFSQSQGSNRWYEDNAHRLPNGGIPEKTAYSYYYDDTSPQNRIFHIQAVEDFALYRSGLQRSLNTTPGGPNEGDEDVDIPDEEAKYDDPFPNDHKVVTHNQKKPQRVPLQSTQPKSQDIRNFRDNRSYKESVNSKFTHQKYNDYSGRGKTFDHRYVTSDNPQSGYPNRQTYYQQSPNWQSPSPNYQPSNQSSLQLPSQQPSSNQPSLPPQSTRPTRPPIQVQPHRDPQDDNKNNDDSRPPYYDYSDNDRRWYHPDSDDKSDYIRAYRARVQRLQRRSQPYQQRSQQPDDNESSEHLVDLQDELRKMTKSRNKCLNKIAQLRDRIQTYRDDRDEARRSAKKYKHRHRESLQDYEDLKNVNKDLIETNRQIRDRCRQFKKNFRRCESNIIAYRRRIIQLQNDDSNKVDETTLNLKTIHSPQGFTTEEDEPPRSNPNESDRQSDDQSNRSPSNSTETPPRKSKRKSRSRYREHHSSSQDSNSKSKSKSRTPRKDKYRSRRRRN